MELDTVELAMAFEEAFAIEIPDAAVEKILTVGDAADFIAQELARTGRPMNRDEVFERVRRVTADKTGLDPARIKWDDRFVLDLGLD